MPLGWIDFSKSERNKVLSVLDRLSEPGTVDEMGIAPVRDGFADLFFPGTSTIQTRAKYFLMIPYIFRDLERNDETDPRRQLTIMEEKEKECAKLLLEKNGADDGIIGSRSLPDGWVKRPPSSIYWAGLRTYGIFTRNLTLWEYLRASCIQKSRKDAVKKLGNRKEKNDEDTVEDDLDAGGIEHIHFWTVETYKSGWAEDLNLPLKADEGAYLKRQIIRSRPDSMLAYVLKHDLKEEIQACNTFQDMRTLMQIFPETIRQDYMLAYDFSQFHAVLLVLYNDILADGKNTEIGQELNRMMPNLPQIAEIDLEGIIIKLKLSRNPELCKFLRKSKAAMASLDMEELKKLISRRERDLKTDRAKTLHPGSLDPQASFKPSFLGYRFRNAKTLIRDIFESEVSTC